MKLEGTYRFPQALEQVWTALNDPAVLERATPGCKSLTQVGPGEYEAELEMGVANIKGKYKGKVSITDPEPPNGYRLKIEGKGGPGFVRASVAIRLSPEESGTRLTYEGEAQVGGMIAGVGQRILGGVAKLTMEQFFKVIEREAG